MTNPRKPPGQGLKARLLGRAYTSNRASTQGCWVTDTQVTEQPYRDAELRSRVRTPYSGGSTRSLRSSGSRPCRHSDAGPCGCQDPPPPGPCLQETRDYQGPARGRRRRCTGMHCLPPSSKQPTSQLHLAANRMTHGV